MNRLKTLILISMVCLIVFLQQSRNRAPDTHNIMCSNVGVSSVLVTSDLVLAG